MGESILSIRTKYPIPTHEIPLPGTQTTLQPTQRFKMHTTPPEKFPVFLGLYLVHDFPEIRLRYGDAQIIRPRMAGLRPRTHPVIYRAGDRSRPVCAEPERMSEPAFFRKTIVAADRNSRYILW